MGVVAVLNSCEGEIFVREDRGIYRLIHQNEDGEQETVVTFSRSKLLFHQPDLVHGDCEDNLSEIDDGGVNLIIDDSPYGNTQQEWDNEPDWDKLTDEFGQTSDRHS
jgi:hypothetical protein